MWYPEFSYFFSAMIALALSSFWNETSVPSLQTHDGNELAFIGVWSARVRIGPGSGYSVMPKNREIDCLQAFVYAAKKSAFSDNS